MTDMREALKPCPFCNSKSLTLTVNEHNWKIVECDDCGMRGPCIDLEGDAYLERWNTRAALAAPGEPVALAAPSADVLYKAAKAVCDSLANVGDSIELVALRDAIAIYASPRALDVTDVEAIARAIHKARGLNPDCLHQNYGYGEPVDAEIAGGKTAHFGWRKSVPLAEAAIAALAKGSK